MAKHHPTLLPRALFRGAEHRGAGHEVDPLVREASTLRGDALWTRLSSRPQGLSSQEAAERLDEYGHNAVASNARTSVLARLAHAVVNPLVALLAVLAAISFATGDYRAGTIMCAMMALSVGLTLVQESRADSAAARLKAMISVTATVVRDGVEREVPLYQLVPGDVVRLAAGDMVPGDVRIVAAKDLFVMQSALTGETFPEEKFEHETKPDAPPLERTSLAFLGTNVGSGSATAVVAATGKRTYLGSMATALEAPPAPTAFDQGIRHVTWLLLRFLLVMVPLVFLINGLTKGNWTQAFFFAVAVAVGLTPEMLPMIVTVCLSKGALAMSKEKVIVKHLNAIQNLGAMDVLCTDKTGTLTVDRVMLERYCDVVLEDDPGVLGLAFLNSHFQTGLRNVLDRAILAHVEAHEFFNVAGYQKIDEIPFDFERRIMSVVVKTPDGHDLLVAKGAPEAIFAVCTSFELDGELLPMEREMMADLTDEHRRLSADGFRVLAVASKVLAPREGAYGKADEEGLSLNGYVAFLDPPKESARTAIAALEEKGITVKVLTGDDELVAQKVCKEVGVPTERVVLGAAVEAMSDTELAVVAESTALFARVSPSDKERILRALRSRGHTVGYLGDGINDAPALRAADVSVSVDTAVDIAKESADLILLEKSLMVLAEGVTLGRKVFFNILKYVRMGASSNFGNMFSVLGASVLVPFLPMLPIQILTNNLLYDMSQTAIPTDEVDDELVTRPRPWDMKRLTRFILCVGPISSVFDYATFFVLLYLFGCRDVSTPQVAAHSAALFQAGWFVESIATQTLIIHVIRTNKVPFLQSRPSAPMVWMSLAVIATGIALPLSPLGRSLGFAPLPGAYWPFLVGTLLTYGLVTQAVKRWLLRVGWID